MLRRERGDAWERAGHFGGSMKIIVVMLSLLLFGVGTASAIDCIPKRDAKGHIVRSAKQVNAFKRANPCPANGRTTGACPGFIVDHKIALCVCGKDRPFNMQWQTVLDAKKKDRTECRVQENN